ncbi:histidine kinase CKI1-like [Apium graveolens]|uniref:histidine kinase CKI1-like n=1 Tax=Apium graveolens TaxID=4045 RepID=UPI003D79704D
MAMQEDFVTLQDVANRSNCHATTSALPGSGAVLVPSSLMFNYWHSRGKSIEQDVRLFSQNLQQEILYGVGVKADLFSPLQSSANNLARILSSRVNATQLPIPVIEFEVAPLLFQAFSTIPYVSQVSFIGKDVALDSANGNSSVGHSWIDSQDILFFNTALMDGRGAVSMGFETKGIVQSLSGNIRNDGSLFLATKDGQVLNKANIQNTRIVIDSNNSVAFVLSNQSGDKLEGHIVGNLTCQENDGTLQPKTITASGTNCCSIKKSDTVGCCIKETKGCNSSSRRKCIQKSTNYASASHDVRGSLAGIAGLIEIALIQVDRGSDLEANIMRMKTCSDDLLAILNNILDRSKLEAGKVPLDEEEFEVSKLIEDVTDLFHAVGIKKGVEWYVSVRAYARKPRSSSSRLNSTRKGPWSWLLWILGIEACTDYGTTVNSFQKNENCVEFIFEVDDTGVGIPKDKQETVFDNYAQIKETSAGKEGTGLGLGIVQSLVRLMGGDIEIVDKDACKRGTCFKFNTYFSVCETDQRISSGRDQSDDIESVGGRMSSGESYSARSLNLIISPNTEGSQVVIFIKNEERRKVCKKFYERQGLKVFGHEGTLKNFRLL